MEVFAIFTVGKWYSYKAHKKKCLCVERLKGNLYILYFQGVHVFYNPTSGSFTYTGNSSLCMHEWHRDDFIEL